MPEEREFITQEELCALVCEQLAQCRSEELALFERMSVVPHQIIFDRGTFAEAVFVVAQTGSKVLFYDDAEEAFEIGVPDADGVLRQAGCGQFTLGHALAHLRLGWR